MNVELRQLRCLVAIVDEGTFTDAAIALGVSQAAVSRTLPRSRSSGCGCCGAPPARSPRRRPDCGCWRMLGGYSGEVADLVQEATSGRASLRIGYAWSALGRHTLAFQRDWARAHPETELRLVARTPPPPASPREPATRQWCADPWTTGGSTPSWGLERRLCALAADDPLAGRRSVRTPHLGGRVLLIDRRTGTTT